ncbi:hypothetical protein BDBG_08939 [Blastomyces gilchristii SLH14081]|uniref:Uncharacterized protein n=1 Tax=Blastomyces gilchristii (strain SLH14081) TaxID=559298 RepID=A0A179V155_BLAGS|nr:uncharacterized protein BDBG_08939 [Blastomyces gilchristii SLH14081]EQL29608.1 hypothetical protein BDFG_07830 [Blastomyces dermatitidis ATCC 26199]OAT13810.1 hypothetical protein BDBG_08939 [Blastomyces gilchristii SLH14081]
MPKPTMSNGTKAPPPSPLRPQIPPGSPNHANPPQPVTMEQLQELFMDVLCQAKQSSDSSTPIEDTEYSSSDQKPGYDHPCTRHCPWRACVLQPSGAGRGIERGIRPRIQSHGASRDHVQLGYGVDPMTAEARTCISALFVE